MDWDSVLDNILNIFGPVAISFITSQNTQQGAEQATALLQEFISGSQQMIEDTRIEADYLIQQGETAAAADLIENTTKGIDQIWKGADLGVESIERFMGQARKTLAPVIEQGGYASDEQARMLGIKDSSGKINEFDPSIIENTPGFKFRQEWGQRGVENAAVGRQLSGQSARELADYNQGLAGTYFDKRYDQLGSMATRGAQGSATLAQLYGNAGGQAANLYGQAGGDAGRLYGTLGANLGNLRVGAAGSRSELLTGAASSIANLGLAGINSQNATTQQNIGANNSFLNGLAIAMGSASGTFGNNSNGSNEGRSPYTATQGFTPRTQVNNTGNDTFNSSYPTNRLGIFGDS